MTRQRRAGLVAAVSVATALVTFSTARVEVAAQRGGGARPPDVSGVAPQAPQPQKGTALVLGQVVDAASGQPIAEAIVAVNSRIPIASLQSAPTPGAGLRLITGADGQFVLHGLPRTNLIINVTAAGYVNGTSGQTRPNGPSRPVEVEDGQRLTDLKIKLWKYAVVTGTVHDEAGEPAVGVSVRALRRSTASGSVNFSTSGTGATDDRGVYRISGLTPGDYTLAVPNVITSMPTAFLEAMMQSVGGGLQNAGLAEIAMSEGGAMPPGGGIRIGNQLISSSSGLMPPVAANGRMSAYQSLFYPAATSAADASVVTLRSGEERTDLDLQLKVIPAARVSGTVTGPSGPASSATVRLLPADVDDTGLGGGFEAASATTAADGTFTFFGVAAGQYVARVMQQPRPPMPAGMADSPIMQLALGRGGGPGTAPLHARAGVTVTGADVAGVSLALGEGIKVAGRLVFDGTAAPPTAQQLQTMSLTMTAVGGNQGAFASPVRPGADLRFQTPGQPAGKYSFVPAARGGGGWVLRSATAGGRDVLNEPIELRDADVNDVVITYTDKISQITGTVHSPSAVLPNTTVVMIPADTRTWIARGMNVRLMRTVLVQKTGAFVIGNVPTGEFLVAALDDADVPENQDAAFVEAVARVATRVQIAEGDRPALDLQVVRVRR